MFKFSGFSCQMSAIPGGFLPLWRSLAESIGLTKRNCAILYLPARMKRLEGLQIGLETWWAYITLYLCQTKRVFLRCKFIKDISISVVHSYQMLFSFLPPSRLIRSTLCLVWLDCRCWEMSRSNPWTLCFACLKMCFRGLAFNQTCWAEIFNMAIALPSYVCSQPCSKSGKTVNRGEHWISLSSSTYRCTFQKDQHFGSLAVAWLFCIILLFSCHYVCTVCVMTFMSASALCFLNMSGL